jgi:predicted metal-binding membrane protein
MQQAALVAAMGLTIVAAWRYVLRAAMAGPHHAHLPGLAAGAMWIAMMLGMMLPAAVPMCATYVRVASRDGRRQWLAIAAFVGAYVALWIGVSALAAWTQQQAADAGLWSRLSPGAQTIASGAMLIAAGLYQFTPLKHACLRRCRTPLGFLLTEWRPGASGALRLGFLHGRDCIFCCWSMLALMFIVGTMNLLWMAALTVLMLVEKCAPGGPVFARLSGAALVAWGLTRLI